MAAKIPAESLRPLAAAAPLPSLKWWRGPGAGSWWSSCSSSSTACLARTCSSGGSCCRGCGAYSRGAISSPTGRCSPSPSAPTVVDPRLPGGEHPPYWLSHAAVAERVDGDYRALGSERLRLLPHPHPRAWLIWTVYGCRVAGCASNILNGPRASVTSSPDGFFTPSERVNSATFALTGVLRRSA
jgi:hypothetical protein